MTSRFSMQLIDPPAKAIMQFANTMGTQHKWSKRKVVMIPKAWDHVIVTDIPRSDILDVETGRIEQQLGVTPSSDMVCKEESQTPERRKGWLKEVRGWMRVTRGWKESQEGAKHGKQ